MIKIEKIIPGGQAIGTDPSGKKIFFWNALPGETVTDYNIAKDKTHYAEAIARSIENPSPHRTDPRDYCFLSTSPWQIMDYNYELKIKQELVVEMFREHSISLPTPEIYSDGKDYFYRNKMEYALYYNNDTNKINLAFHARGSHRKIPITKSSIERTEIFEAATKIISDLNSRGEEARKYQSLLLRCNSGGEVSGGLLENHQPHPTFSTLSDKILDYEYSYSPNGFFQINLPVYEMALTEIKKHITTEKVLDLYAGVGTIGLSVARDNETTLVEVDKAAFSELEKNCAASQKNSLRAVLSKSEEALDYVAPDQTVIVDPPRAGCDFKLIQKLLKTKPEKIIYLSCSPATQARDVKKLLESYRINTVKTFNFFPHTPHIENLVILSKMC